MSARALRTRRADYLALVMLVAVVLLSFAPFVFADRSLTDSTWSAASLYSTGSRPTRPADQVERVLDAGAPAWQTEPEFRLIHRIIFGERKLPLWNPYAGYGMPLAANMLSQSFSPLAIPVILDPVARVYTLWTISRLCLAAILTYGFLRLFLPVLPAFVGATQYALCGYALLYLTMPDIGVTALLPGLLVAIEALIRRPSMLRSAGLACVIGLVALVGMPEPEALVFIFAGIYWLLRVLGATGLRPSVVPVVGYSITAVLLGLGVSAILIVPFLQYVPSSYNIHVVRDAGQFVGLRADTFQIGALAQYLCPLLFGPPKSGLAATLSGANLIRGFAGGVGICFAVVAIRFGWASRTRTADCLPINFFAVVALIVMLKRFGAWPINAIGYLPILRLIEFPKYAEPIFEFCLTMLCAFGFDYVRRKHNVDKSLTFTSGLALLFVTSLWILAMRVEPDAMHRFTLPAGALCFGYLASTFLACLTGFPERYPKIFSFVAASLIVTEPIFGFVVPLYYEFNENPSISVDAARGTDYVRFLQKNDSPNQRVFGVRGMLHPEWSDAFGLRDVRALDALYPERYFPFLRALLPSAGGDELSNRFTGDISLAFTTPRQQRFLSLSAIRFIISDHTFGTADTINDAVGDPTKMFLGSYDMRGVREVALFVRSGDDVAATIKIPPTATRLRIAPFAFKAIDGAQIARSCQIVLTDARGADRLDAVVNTIGPSLTSQRASNLALGRFAGQTVRIHFRGNPRASEPSASGWMIFGDIAFVAKNGTIVDSGASLRRVWNSARTVIYEVPKATSRLRLYHAVVPVPDGKAALKVLAGSAFDVNRAALVEGNVPAAMHAGNGARALPAQNIPLTSTSSTMVSAMVDVVSPSLLVLSDTDYPGWKATIDGRPTQIVAANYLFRGIFIGAGRHSVSFRYVPAPIAVGLSIASLSIFLIAMLFIVGVLRTIYGAHWRVVPE